MKKELIENTIKELNKIKEIKDFIKNNNLTFEEILSNLPILCSVEEEFKLNTRFKSTLFMDENREIHRKHYLSRTNKSFSRKNIITQEISWVDPSISLKTFTKNQNSFREVVTPLKKIIKKIKDNKPDYNIGKGFYLYGGIGSGKSYLLKLMANLCMSYNSKVAFINTSEFLAYIKASNDKNGVINKIKNVDFLFIDDIGGETVVEWFRDDYLFNLFNWRAERRLMTFFSSNYSFANLLKKESTTTFNKTYQKYNGQKLIERIKMLSTPFEITGKNLRN